MWIVCQAYDLQEMSTYFYEKFKKKKKMKNVFCYKFCFALNVNFEAVLTFSVCLTCVNWQFDLCELYLMQVFHIILYNVHEKEAMPALAR